MIEKNLTCVEVAAVLRISAIQVADLCRSGKIRATRPAKQWLIPESAVREYLNGGKAA